MSRVFDAYARYYDLLYQDKDYAAEAAYVDAQIQKSTPAARRILELGCGTGAHAEHLARMGYTVRGVDRSAAMLAGAEKRKSGLPAEVAARLSFSLGDVRSARTGEIFDAVISLFHVMSYQISDADLDSTFETAATHLQPGGSFLFDFWYGPAVLAQQPGTRVRRLADDEIEVTRIAEPVMLPDENRVNVNYTVFVKQKASAEITEITETHAMRYLFTPELKRLRQGRFAHGESRAWMSDAPLDAQSWTGLITVIRI
ncbi:MAG: methyltransferase domain-containing protein [Rhodocyclales bacterium]|nr:methyltransferase domain-containing protein [Rhodocyclales bacterium]